MAVSEMRDAGHDAHFLANGEAYAVHRSTGQVASFVRTKGVYEIEAKAPPYAEVKATGGKRQLGA